MPSEEGFAHNVASFYQQTRDTCHNQNNGFKPIHLNVMLLCYLNINYSFALEGQPEDGTSYFPLLQRAHAILNEINEDGFIQPTNLFELVENIERKTDLLQSLETRIGWLNDLTKYIMGRDLSLLKPIDLTAETSSPLSSRRW